MSILFALCQWLEHSSMGTAVRESTWLFPTIETLHIFGIILLVGSTSILDLRLLGWAFREDSVSQLARRYLPWTWAGFVDPGRNRVSSVRIGGHKDVRQCQAFK